jgi:pimeloyl-ACP methyl ester carboxylesterase
MPDTNHYSESKAPPDHLVILVHGINTRAIWMSELRHALEQTGFAVAQTSFGKFSLPQFLSPLTGSRDEAVKRVLGDIRTARTVFQMAHGFEPKKMSVIAHSFGTYVVSRILLEEPGLQWDRVIFCGSVVREDFPLDKVLARFRHPLLNEIGTKDYLPALAESAGWDYGSVGSTGFNRPPVQSRWHKGFRHSDFLTEKFCKAAWVDFLHGEKPSRGDEPSAMPPWIPILTAIPLRWLILAILAIALTLVIPPLFRTAVQLDAYFNRPYIDQTKYPAPTDEMLQKFLPGNTIEPGSYQETVHANISSYLGGDWIVFLDGRNEQKLVLTQIGSIGSYGARFASFDATMLSYQRNNIFTLITPKLLCDYRAKFITTTQVSMKWRDGDPTKCPTTIIMGRPAN